MPVPIRTDQVREALLPFLGPQLLAGTPMAERASEVLRGFIPFQQPLEELHQHLCQLLFDGLFACLGHRMTFRLDDGRLIRIRMDDIPDLADTVLGVLLESLPVSQSTLDLLRDYAMRATSLSTLRVLLTRFGRYQSPDEQAIIRRVVRDNYPPERYQSWL